MSPDTVADLLHQQGFTADAGGSNGYRTRAWKAELAAFAARAGLEITCCHFPPGTSKWNAIEYRPFAHISMNWRGRPLTSHEVIISTTAATTTRTGLRVRVGLDTSVYPAGIWISDAQMAALPLARHDWHGDWNYTLPPCHPARPGPRLAARPALTRLTAPQRDTLTAQLAAARHAQREASLHRRRGASRTSSSLDAEPGAGSAPACGFSLRCRGADATSRGNRLTGEASWPHRAPTVPATGRGLIHSGFAGIWPISCPQFWRLPGL